MKSRISRRSFLRSAALALSPAGGLLARALDTPRSGGWRDAAVIDLRRSPYARLRPVPVRAVVLADGFWSRRRTTNLDASIPSMHDELIDHGRLDNFLRLAGRSPAPQRGPVYSDSDLYKWIEAAAFHLQSADLPGLRSTADGIIRAIVAAQEPGGYLNTYYAGERSSLRMQYEVQTTGHELYCIGHLLQAAIALYRATGDRVLLEAGIRFVDEFLLPGYGPGPDRRAIVAGHPEIEMALIELYRTTGARACLDLAGYILEGDPRIRLRPEQISYMFCGVPFSSRTRLEGHAVRAMYACSGATDYYLETGDPAYWKALTTLWDDLVRHQLYITGGVGAREAGEAFGEPYELPNARAYGESCAAIGNMMWNARMLAASGEARFADVIERALYNGINSGMSLDGLTYCYRNPLAFDPAPDAGAPQPAIRNAWYDTTCCPPNLERTFAALPGYFYSTASDGIYVHLYDSSELNWRLEDGNAINIVQRTRYPWEGDVHLALTPGTPSEFTVHVRIPGWSRRNTVRVNGRPPGDGVSGEAVPGEYMAIRRQWSAGDTIDLGFDMGTLLLGADPRVDEDRGRVAFTRGPLVFCMEGIDQPGAAAMTGLSAAPGTPTAAHFDEELLDGVMVLEHPGEVEHAREAAGLYFPVQEEPRSQRSQPFQLSRTTLRLIPYYAWSNRTPTAMQVWVPITPA